MANPLAAAGGFVAGQLGGGAVNNAAGGFFNVFGQIGNAICPVGLVGYDALVEMHRNLLIDDNCISNLTRLHGITYDHIPAIQLQITSAPANGPAVLVNHLNNIDVHANTVARQMLKAMPTVDETLVLLNRNLIDESLADFYLRMNLGGEDALARKTKELRFQIPGPSDLIHFAVRDAFSPDVVAQFQYNKELPVEILPYMEAQGLHGDLGINIPPGSTTTSGPDIRTKAQWFDLYWWSHWQLVSPTQGYEMLHRLYLTSDYGAAPGVNAQNHFTSQDLNLLLKANDYPPFWRSRLEEISYHPLTRVDVRRMYDLDLITDAGVYHSYRAGGYSDANAKNMLEFARSLRDEGRHGATKKATIKEIRELYMLGVLSREQAYERLNVLVRHFSMITPMLNLWDTQKHKLRVKDMLKVLRGGYMLGTYSNTQIRNALFNLGFSNPVVADYLTDWEFIKLGQRKFLSAATNQDHYVHGMISRNVYIVKLRNLNYHEDEVQQMVRYGDAKIQYEANLAMQKQVKAILKAKEEQVKAMLAPYTDPNIKKFYKAGQLTLKSIWQILTLRGWTPNAAKQWMASYLGEEITPEMQSDFNEDGNTEDEAIDESTNTNDEESTAT